MSRDYKLFLQDILEAAQHVEAFVKDMRFEDFVQDEKTSSAVIRKLEVIGEAVNFSAYETHIIQAAWLKSK